MKITRTVRLASLTVLMGLGLGSCKDYLEEELVSTLTNDYFSTEQGLEDLVKSSYEQTRYKFALEHSFAMFNYGVDEMTSADQINVEWWNRYDNRLNSSDGFVDGVWTADYDGINRCNIGISRIPGIQGTTTLRTDAQKTQRLAELRFLRAYYYFQLVQQYGAIPLLLEPTEGVKLDYTRAPVPDVYRTIIADLKFASDNLAPTTPDFGRATKNAAMHYLAKVYLTRGSAVTDVRGQKPTDMDSAAYYADQVITSNRNPLAANYADLFDVANSPTTPFSVANPATYTNSVAAQTNREVLFSAQFNNIVTLSGRFGNRVHSYFTLQYDNEPGMNRDVLNDRPFRRVMPTNYAMDIFDRRNDSRFYKIMKTAWIANHTSASSYPRWTAADAPTPAQVGQPKFAINDTAFYVIVNTRENPIPQAQINRSRYKIFARFVRNAAGNVVTGAYDPTGTLALRNKFPQLIKHTDPYRPSAAEEAGTKDGLLARSGETYLIAAEAYGRKGNYTKALEYINVLRQRAAYKAGEVKPSVNWRVEGGTRGDVTSSYPAITARLTNFTTNDPKELYPSSVTTTEQRFIHFILNERTRELLGELHRWEDLARTETLQLRAPLFNPDAAGATDPKFKLRPIPQTHLERIFRNGQPLTNEERQAEQNPGY
ncbi:RagB/SusD family nutrient uptake outer membrane protein [Hymenobacter sp. YC55]|uniref:RagB/SusD family nutrient uptake outer membrane protein n=1 Tax=Hymenobacter sp. YC55 TaxID=3034019 RepID=UPI0023FA0F77|nr:RagB/SusD family nutrient uptake outer membrane protein [Hymenobacter sp. YC55]MDF7810812.1 RagB/SusD family nutrient uptake outer membrane protein [Hymenobacter sp. YC55]